MEEYHTSDVERELGMDRLGLICLALLLGSDYTEGVAGIGIVNAVEVGPSLMCCIRLHPTLYPCCKAVQVSRAPKSGLVCICNLAPEAFMLAHKQFLRVLRVLPLRRWCRRSRARAV